MKSLDQGIGTVANNNNPIAYFSHYKPPQNKKREGPPRRPPIILQRPLANRDVFVSGVPVKVSPLQASLQCSTHSHTSLVFGKALRRGRTLPLRVLFHQDFDLGVPSKSRSAASSVARRLFCGLSCPLRSFSRCLGSRLLAFL